MEHFDLSCVCSPLRAMLATVRLLVFLLTLLLYLQISLCTLSTISNCFYLVGLVLHSSYSLSMSLTQSFQSTSHSFFLKVFLHSIIHSQFTILLVPALCITPRVIIVCKLCTSYRIPRLNIKAMLTITT